MSGVVVADDRGQVECTVRRHADGVSIRLTATDHEGRNVHGARFRIGASGEQRGVAMVLAPRGRTVDLRGDPGALYAAADAAVAALHPRRSDHALCEVGEFLLREAAELAVRTEVPVPIDTDAVGVVGIATAFGFPMARMAFDAGAGTVGHFPRWAMAPLAAAQARAAAVELVGRVNATRRLVASLARSLAAPPFEPPVAPIGVALPGHHAVWFGDGEDRPPLACFSLAVAAMARDVLDPDRLATVLDAAGRPHVPAQWPRVDDIELARRWFPIWGVLRVARVLRDAITLPNGPTLLADTVLLQQAVALADPTLVGRRQPNRLVELHEHLLGRLPLDPRAVVVPNGMALLGRQLGELPRARPRRPRVVPPAEVAEVAGAPLARGAGRRPAGAPVPRNRAQIAAARARAEALAEPAPPLPPPLPPLPASTALTFPAEVRALHQREVDRGAPSFQEVRTGNPDRRLTFTVPRTVGELRAWGQRVGNCIGSYGDLASTGRCWLVGVCRDGELHYTIEILPDRSIRQFVGLRNTAPDRGDALAILAALVTAGVVPARNARLPSGG